MAQSWIPLGVGLVFFGMGVALLIARATVARFFANRAQDVFGRFGRRLASWTTPRQVRGTGISFILFGALMASLSVASLLGAFERGG